MTDLSPAAQAVKDAVSTLYSDKVTEAIGWPLDVPAIVIALRVVADQVVPWQPEPTEESLGPTVNFGYAWALFSKANDVRQELIAIADELELQIAETDD
jgi:hypothetical protein